MIGMAGTYYALAGSVVDAIGGTPLVDLARITRDLEGCVFAKLEMLNPGFSKKDRMARHILDDAEASGELQPGQPVVELTSGNAGMGAAIVCCVQERPFVAVMSEGNSVERAQMMRAVGAEVILVPQAPDSVPGQVSGVDLALVEAETRRITAERGAFRLDQFVRAGNAKAYEVVASEIWQASGGAITAFCDFVGSGGTFAGLQAGFRRLSPDIRGYVVEPAGAAVLAGQPVKDPNHRIQGGGYAMAELPLMAAAEPTGFLQVTDSEAMQASRRLAREEGIVAGFSSGANLAAALQLLNGPERGGSIAIIVCDSGLKYLSTDLWA
ncbi:cysteine synthase family protein [Phenylobacterium sp.]|jgi:cysteine synthase A|uniref:PLP-dependent cysteine synthase family protein n=1 Tax=Phenylobacterium sp. TaxID=1871053 RepID=UPI002F3F2DA1